MPKQRLTDLFVENVRSLSKRLDIRDRDTPGLVLRVSMTGAKSWMFFYRHGGRFRKTVIGNAHKMSLSDARQIARAHRDAVHSGKDPAAPRGEGQPETISDLAALFLERHSKRHKRTWPEDERMFRVYVLPALGSTKIGQAEKRDVLSVIEAVATGDIPGDKVYNGGLRMADRVLTVTRTMFGWAKSEGHATYDPTAGIRRRDKRPPRDRMLSPSEIQALWEALPAIYPDEPRQIAVKLLLATGQRKGEVLYAEPAELSLDGPEPTWTIPGRRTKNKRTHIVPLNPMAVSLWKRALEIAGNTPLVFPASASGGPVAPDLIAKPLSRAFVDHRAKVRGPAGIFKSVQRPRLLGFEPFTPHDLRRSVASHMARLGVDRTVIGKCLNHVSADRLSITGLVYDRHDYAAEKRQALTRWAAELERIIAGADRAKVIAFSR